MALINAVLVVVTFNVYVFWAKSNVRDYLWRTTTLQDSALRYSGDGRQICRGFLLSAALFLVVFGYPLTVAVNAVEVDLGEVEIPDPGVIGSLIIAAVLPVYISVIGLLVTLTPAVDPPTSVVIGSFVVLLLGIFTFIAASRYLTYQYLFTHTQWRGCNGRITGSAWGYAAKVLAPELSVALTVGWSAPWRFVRRFDPILNSAEFAGQSFTFKPNLTQLYRPFAIAWCTVALLTGVQIVLTSTFQPENPVLLGLSIALFTLGYFVGIVFTAAYYNSRLFTHVAESLTLGNVRFSFHASSQDLARLFLTNLAMNLLSGGLSYYFSRMRIARFIARHLQIEGEMPTESSEARFPDRQVLAEGVEILLAGSYF